MKTVEEIKEMIEEKKKTIEMLKANNWGIGTAKQEWEIEMLEWVIEDSEDENNI